jgi:NADH-quinone oxidoreductase subunit J
VLVCFAAAVAAIVLIAFFPDDLARPEFWAGAVGFVSVLSALMVTLHPNPMVSVLFLIVNLFCMALFFLILQAQTLAALQVIVYAGAIMVLFVFVIMLLNLRAEQGLRTGRGAQRWAALAFSAAFAALLFYALRHRHGMTFVEPQPFLEGFGTARDLGSLLFGEYLFATEAASVLLIAAMVGAVILAKRRLD